MIPQTPLTMIFQFMVLAQPFFFMWLWDQEIFIVDRGLDAFYIFCGVSALLIGVFNIEVGYYSTRLLLQYVLFVALSTKIYNGRFGARESICLAFLTVYLNSYYWELVLHLMEYRTLQFHIGMVVQLMRLTPLLFFKNHVTLNKRTRELLLYGVGYSLITVYIRITYHIFNSNLAHFLHFANRAVCLGILIKVIIDGWKKRWTYDGGK